MDERYDRIVCAGELLIRIAVIQKVVSGWTMVDSFRFPGTVGGAESIGGGT